MIREIVQLGAGIYQRLTGYLGYAPDPYLPWFGDGADGDLSVANGQTVTVTVDKFYKNVTVNQGGTLVVGTDGAFVWPTVRVSGALSVAGTIRAAYGDNYSNRKAGRKTTAGNGSTDGAAMTAFLGWGRPGGAGAGGGDGNNSGGAARNTGSYIDLFMSNGVASTPSGTTGSGVNGSAAIAVTTNAFSYFTSPRLPGVFGSIGGGGSLKNAGTGNYGGAGGVGGRPGGVLDLRARSITIAATGIIHADGDVGGNGEDGAAVAALGDIAGGGGAGGGGGGGTCLILYRTLSNSGTVRAAGGAGGTGGAGKEYTAGGANQARATSNGGNGAAGGTGIVCLTRI